MANYEEALKAWGIKKLQSCHPYADFDPASITVEITFNEGFVCCGPDQQNSGCYCSMAESPSANVSFRGRVKGVDGRFPTYLNAQMSAMDFDFATVLKEIVEAGDGTITA